MWKYFIIFGLVFSPSVVWLPLGLTQEVTFKEDQEGIGKLEGDMDRPAFYLKFITAPQSKIRSLCKEITGKAVPGCSQWHNKKKRCIIWVPEPVGLGDWTAFHIAGHELWHCKIGNYHK